MRASLRIPLAVVVSVAVFTGVVGVYAAGPGLTFTERPIATGLLTVENGPVTDGRYVVYQSRFPLAADANWDVRVFDLQTGTSVKVVESTADQNNPDISYDMVAYDDARNGNREIYVYDIGEGGSEYRITTKAGDQVDPRISNHTLIWFDGATDSLWYRDFMLAAAKEIPGTGPVGATDHWDIDGDTVVYSVGPDVYYWTVGSDLPPEKLTAVAFGLDSLRTHAGRIAIGVSGPGTDGATSVTIPDVDPVAIDLDAASNAANPDVFHGGVVWQHDRATDWNLAFAFVGEAGWDPVGATTENETNPSIFGRRVAFERSGGLSATDVYVATSTPEAVRTSGADRYLTAVETSKAYFKTARTAVICTGTNFPDALTAAPLAKSVNAPLLLVKPGEVPAGVLDELDRLGVTNLWIIGGSAVVSDGVVTALETPTRTAERIWGDDRYETAQAVAYRLYDVVTMSQGLPWSEWVFVARGDAFPDALAVAPIAASINAPILLTRTNELPPATAEALEFIKTTGGAVVGGSSVVSDAVKADMQAIIDSKWGAWPLARWSGDDRYATAVDIAENGLAQNWVDLDTLGVATGTNFPDALGGGAALGTYGSPLLLVRQNQVPDPVASFLDDSGYAIGRLDVFGGSDVILDSVKNEIAATLR